MESYINQLLEIIASECNVKEIVLNINDETNTYYFDTWKGKTLQNEDWEKFSLLFVGDILDDMKKVRDCVNHGLKIRSEAGIKVRQPLNSMTITVK